MDEAPHGFSPEELKVLQLIAQGWTVERIARELGVSTRTIKRRSRSLAERLGAYSRAQLVLRAVAMGLLDRDISGDLAPGGHAPPAGGDPLSANGD